MANDNGGGEGVSELVRMLLEDRRLREEATARREAELAEERARREEEHERQVVRMQEQVEMMREWMERSQAREERVSREGDRDKLKLSKLTESEDIEAFLTTFERMMRVYGVKEDRWAFKLAPQLTGRAQQAYAALNVDDAAQYKQVKAAILRRYDINE